MLPKRLGRVTLGLGAGRSIAALSQHILPSPPIDQLLPRLLAHLIQKPNDPAHLLPNRSLSLALPLPRLTQRPDDPQLAEQAGEPEEVLGGSDLRG